MNAKCSLCGKQRTNDAGGCRCAAGYSACHHIAERLRHHARDERNTAFARSSMREAEQELAACRERFAKAAAAFEREQDRALAAEVRAETAEAALASSREREAHLRSRVLSALKIADAALAEGAQG